MASNYSISIIKVMKVDKIRGKRPVIRVFVDGFPRRECA